jgi:hypothetical protein
LPRISGRLERGGHGVGDHRGLAVDRGVDRDKERSRGWRYRSATTATGTIPAGGPSAVRPSQGDHGGAAGVGVVGALPSEERPSCWAKGSEGNRSTTSAWVLPPGGATRWSRTYSVPAGTASQNSVIPYRHTRKLEKKWLQNRSSSPRRSSPA